MATWDDVRRLALALPEATESNDGWRIRSKAFAWVRPLRKKDVADLEALGRPVPAGEIMGIRLADEGGEAGADRQRARRLLHDPALRRLARRAGPPRRHRRRRARGGPDRRLARPGPPSGSPGRSSRRGGCRGRGEAEPVGPGGEAGRGFGDRAT
ncbi:hypothetical protein [Nocardioides sp. TF02-7]|uniref:hypothetical protein n=1 Tax=Nocardioides sp. TF02-7 TaxID=2917724 RepID=UPI001F0688E2|nr:hypothetical protein [Nocardioides sp. TF02-7]UMG92011.1 hypothetical protein MF408_18765 [Nocardioides sp. TF02-7]